MARQRKRPASKFDAVPQEKRRGLQTVTVVGAVVVFVVAVVLLAATAYRTGFSPMPTPYRTGTVEVESCSPMAWQLGVWRCEGQASAWQPTGEPPDDLDLTDADRVVVTSRTELTGTVEVTSYRAQVTTRSEVGVRAPETFEVIMPSDQRPLSDGLKLLLGIAAFASPFIGATVIGRIAWELALRRATSDKS